MRTSVTIPDQEDTDEFPGCMASVGEDGNLIICDADMNVETTYAKGDWSSVEVNAE